MQITSRGRYAITALVDLASNNGYAPVTLKGISDRQNISVSYLEQIFGNLRRHNIVKSVRGPGGGYYLAVPPAKISIEQIVKAVDDPKDLTNFDGKGNGQNSLMCTTDSLWSGLDDVLYSYLSTVNLQQLIDLNRQDIAEATAVTTRKHARNEQSSARLTLHINA